MFRTRICCTNEMPKSAQAAGQFRHSQVASATVGNLLRFSFLLAGLLCSDFAYAQSAPPVPFFLDARSTAMSRDGKRQVLTGDVLVIGAGTLISADEISLKLKLIQI